VEFLDFQCPFCAKFAQNLFPQIERKYVETGQLQVVFRNYPLSIHPHAERAAESAVCAASQGKFWPLHASLFDAARESEDPDFFGAAKQAGIDEGVFSACMAGNPASNVQQDIQYARALGVSETPTFLIGRRLADGRVTVLVTFAGASSMSQFDAAFQKAAAVDTK